MKKIVRHWYDKLLSMLLMLLGFGKNVFFHIGTANG